MEHGKSKLTKVIKALDLRINRLLALFINIFRGNVKDLIKLFKIGIFFSISYGVSYSRFHNIELKKNRFFLILRIKFSVHI